MPDDDGSRISRLEEELSQLRQDRRDIQIQDRRGATVRQAGGRLRKRGGRTDRPAGLDQGTTEEPRQRRMAMAVQRTEPGAGISGRHGPAQRAGIARQGIAHRHRPASQARSLPGRAGRQGGRDRGRHQAEGSGAVRGDLGQRGHRPDGHPQQRGRTRGRPHQPVPGNASPERGSCQTGSGESSPQQQGQAA